MSTQTPTRIPQPTRLLHPSSPSTKKSILSPKTWSSSSPSPKRASVSKYQLQDPGVVPGFPEVVKRMTIRPPCPGSTGGSGTGNSNAKTVRVLGKQRTDNTPTRRTIPSASFWTKPLPSSYTTPTSSCGRRTQGESIPPPTSAFTTPTRIPAPRPRTIPNSRVKPSTSKSHLPPSPAISICATVATAPSTPVQRSSIPIPIPTSRSRIPIPVSPAISIAATVATALPSLTPRVELSRETSDTGSEVDIESIYSSASALALARYRASLPTLAKDVTASAGYDHDLSRMGSTTSFSSASSLARHRLSQRHSLSSSSNLPEAGQSVPMSTTTTTTEDMALVWQPDPESQGSDPAANLWMEIEARLNRRSVGVMDSEGRDERGQWVLTRQRNRQVQDRQVASQEDKYWEGPKDVNDGKDGNEKWTRSQEMKKESSEFTISAYFDPDLSTPIPPSSSCSFRSSSSAESGMGARREGGMEGTAIFNMAAPLIASINPGSEGGISATPANTPLIYRETIQRVSRVRKSYSGSSSGSRSGSIRMSSMRSATGSVSLVGSISRGRSDSSCAVVDLDQSNVPESIPMVESNTADLDGNKDGMESEMMRLDSHVQAALEVLSDNPNSSSSIDFDTDIDINQAQSSYSGKDGQGSSPYTEKDELTPMPIPIPILYHHTPTGSHPYQTRPELGDTYSTPT